MNHASVLSTLSPLVLFLGHTVNIKSLRPVSGNNFWRKGRSLRAYVAARQASKLFLIWAECPQPRLHDCMLKK